MTYTCLIVDDERPALKLLAAYIDKLPHLTLMDSCEDALQAMAALQKHQVDILFLDIQMPGFTGLELMRVLKEKPQIILTTAYREFAVDGFALDATDYLVKPFSFERFSQAVNKATDLINLRKGTNHGIRTVPISPTQSKAPSFFFAKTHHKLEKIAVEDIRYVESLREYAAVHTEEKRFVVSQTMKTIEAELPADQFIRVHRTYIVAIAHIKEIYGNTIVVDGKEIPIGGSYKKDFFEKVRLL